MADALVSTPVACVAGIAAGVLLGVAGTKVKRLDKENLIPLMGVMGAFVFAAQMINFSIPGTGSSGHIIGGILLAALLGPWAAFLTLSSVLIIQCLIFADGGLLALGCNIINMAAMTCLVAYPLLFRPLLRFPASSARIFSVSVLACVCGLEAGACCVTLETLMSGVSSLPATRFLILMTAIHLAIGIGEGLATGAVLSFIQKARPDILVSAEKSNAHSSRKNIWSVVICFAVVALGFCGLSFFASPDPDGLEWSIEKLTGSTELSDIDSGHIPETAQKIVDSTAIIPDYNNDLAGIIGSVLVLVLVWAVASLLMSRKGAVRKR